MNNECKKNNFIKEYAFNQQEVYSGFTMPCVSGILPDCLEQILPCMGADSAAYMRQVHGAAICWAHKPGEYCCDGLFSTEHRIALLVKTADCLPLVFSNRHAIGVVHMGWRSAEAGILERIPLDILAECTVIAGPGLRRCCYQVGEEFASIVSFKDFLERRCDGLYFDVIAFARSRLTIRGLRPDAFYDCGICSFCSASKLPSYRRLKTAERTISFIVKTV